MTKCVFSESKGVTYVYEMTQQPKYSHDPAYGPESARKPSFCECDHTDDMTFTMGIPLTDKKLSIEAKFTDDEKELSKEWMKYIVNFAENGWVVGCNIYQIDENFHKPRLCNLANL